MKAFSLVVIVSLLLSSSSVIHAAVDKAALRETLATQEYQLAAAERDLLHAQEALRKAEAEATPTRMFGLLFTGLGIAGMLAAAAHFNYKAAGGLPQFGSAFGAGAVLTGTGIVVYQVSGTEVRNWQTAVEHRLALVRAAREKLARLKAQIGN